MVRKTISITLDKKSLDLLNKGAEFDRRNKSSFVEKSIQIYSNQLGIK